MGLLLMALSAWGLFSIVIAGALAVAYPLMRDRLGLLHPATRVWVLRALAAGPPVLGGLAVALCFAPKLLGNFVTDLDHCSTHGDGHAHFCFNHPPHLEGDLILFAGLASVATFAIVLVSRHAWRVRESMRALRPLLSTAHFDARRRVWIVDAEMPVALVAGFRRPRTLVSSGLMDRLPERLLDAILAHERAHVRRKDGLFRFATDLVSIGHWPPIRRQLHDDLDLACEQACDEEAGSTLGDRTRVAEALVAVERIRLGAPIVAPGILGFGAHGLAARVESLVGESAGTSWSRRATATLLVGSVAAAFLVADPLHHLTETLLHHLLG